MRLPSPPLVSTLNGTAAAVSKGVNFGAGGGGGGVFRVGAAVGQQVRVAAETLQLMQLEMAEEDSAAAVFVLSFGADAYARLLARGPAAANAAPKHGRRGLGRILADRIVRSVSELYEAGVRRVAVMGVAPLGCAPRVMWEGMRVLVMKSNNNNGGSRSSCVEEANELIQGYNARLVAGLDELRTRLPDADIVFCDVYKGVMEIIATPTRYGFEEATEACCGLGPFKASMGCFSKEMACRSPERHVWWDLYSPTEAVDALVTNWSWSLSPGSQLSICSPIALHQLAGSSSP
ncbi:hypothetical protein QOZ80_9BG0696840 [Eleusine coracana subsp. coracana]|nr:hypothetical protein QOZ80_9BG0696840 [Eleusine coracana subsp. coracana]